MSILTIRPALGRDVADIVNVQQESWQAAYKALLPDQFLLRKEEERIAIWQQRLVDWPCHTLLAEVDGNIAGFLFWQPEQRTRALLGSLYLHPFFWNQGIGHQLLRQGMADMRDEGIQRVDLWVLANNRRAEHFYLREGFRYDGRSQLQAVKAGEYQQRHMFRLLAGL